MVDVRVMTYNVRYFGHGTRGLTSTEAGLQRIADAIAALDPLPSVIALQELDTYSLRADTPRRGRRHKPQLLRFMDALHARLEALKIPTRYQGSYFTSHRYLVTRHASLYSTGLGVLCANDFRVEYRESARERDITHRRVQSMSRLKQTRICAHLRLQHRASGARLEVFNTHLSLPSFFTSWRSLNLPQRMGQGENQLREVASILEFIDQASGCDNILLMGDFNTLPGSPVYEQITAHPSLTDPFRAHTGMDLAALRSYPTAGFVSLRMHLDYIFSSPQLTWLDFDETLPYGAPGPFHKLSDHVPIIGRLRLSER